MCLWLSWFITDTTTDGFDIYVSYDFENLKLEPGSISPLNIGSATQVNHHVTFCNTIFDVRIMTSIKDGINNINCIYFT